MIDIALTSGSTDEKPPVNSFLFLVRSMLQIEKTRVATEARQTHLALRGKQDPETDELLKKLIELERFVDGRIATRIKEHPAYPWFSRVKGVGKENIGKVVGLVDIRRAGTVSALWKFAGYHVVGGTAPKRVKGGGTLEWNSQLRSMCWRLAGSLLKAQGIFYEYYLREKERYYERYRAEGKQVVKASELPQARGKRVESDGVITEGHIHNQALRKMVKLFLACLWHVWREAEGLPTRVPYAHEKQGHTTIIDPWEMVDKPAKKQRKVSAA